METVQFGSLERKVKISNYELTVFVLSDYSRIIESSRLEKILGKEGKSATWLVDFFESKQSVSSNFISKLKSPIAFYLENEEKKRKQFLGYSAFFFIEILNTIRRLQKEHQLLTHEQKTLKAAEKMLSFLENKLIKHLIDEATGFTFYKENTKEKLKSFFLSHQKDNSFEWLITFTDSFFETVFIFLDTNWVDVNHDFIKIADFIHSTIFMRIDDKTLEILRSTKPKRSYINPNGSLANRENPKLKEFNESIRSFFKESVYNRTYFMELLIKTYPKITDREKIIFTFENQNEKLSNFDEKLKLGLVVK